MKQFRIIEVKKGSKIHYEIQMLESFFLFLGWYWSTLTEFTCCNDGSCAGEDPIEFEYIEQAEKYLKEYYPESRKIIKYINV